MVEYIPTSDTREKELLALQADVCKAWSCQDSVPGATVRHGSDIMLMHISNITDVSSSCQAEESFLCSAFLVRPWCLAVLEILWTNRAFWVCWISARQYLGMTGAVVRSHFFLDSAWSSPLWASKGGCRFALCFLRHFCLLGGPRGFGSLSVRAQHCWNNSRVSSPPKPPHLTTHRRCRRLRRASLKDR